MKSKLLTFSFSIHIILNCCSTKNVSGTDYDYHETDSLVHNYSTTIFNEDSINKYDLESLKELIKKRDEIQNQDYGPFSPEPFYLSNPNFELDSTFFLRVKKNDTIQVFITGDLNYIIRKVKILPNSSGLLTIKLSELINSIYEKNFQIYFIRNKLLNFKSIQFELTKSYH